MEKLTLIQNELKVPKGLTNKFGNYKYRSAEQILEACKPILLKHKATLTLTDDITQVGEKIFLKATATLTLDGQSLSVNGFAETGEHKGMSAEQTTGTASSYARKYALNGLFLIDETEQDPDTKDNSGKEVTTKAPTETPKATTPEKQWLTEAQFTKIVERVKAGEKELVAKVLENYRLKKEYKDTLESI